MNPKPRFEIGDLLRLCTTTEENTMDTDSIYWCYGIYLGTRKRDEEAEKYGWTPRYDDVVFLENRVQFFDHYWYIERIS